MSEKPSVLFVCVKNGGKSQMAAGLMRQLLGDQVDVESAGTRPGTALHDLTVRTLADVGVDISAEVPKAITDDMVRSADLVVVLGREAHVDPVDGTPVENWDTDEPSERGIEGPNACASSGTTSPPAYDSWPANSACRWSDLVVARWPFC